MNPANNQPESTDFALEVFFDGACPLCRREINLLKRWDRRGRLHMIDISDPAFEPRAIGKTHEELMARMHGRLPDGTWLQGVEVFRRLYSAIGFGPLVWLTRLPVVTQLLDLGYTFFARHRLRLTGRCTAETCAVKRPSEPTLRPNYPKASKTSQDDFFSPIASIPTILPPG